DWARLPDAHPGSTVGVSRMAVARGFARHLAGIDPRTQVPPVGMLPCRRHRRVPYIYSQAEIASLMALMARKLIDAAGIGVQSAVRPHIHDLRHSFAVHTLVDWYRNGEDVEARLPCLATYLGHCEPRSTYWYLSGAPELLSRAAGRLEAFEEIWP